MERPADWQCPNTGCVNHTKMVFGTKTSCPKCGATPGDAAFAEGPGLGYEQSGRESLHGLQGGDMPGDWACPNADCINSKKLVFGKNDACPKCGTARNAKQPGDWRCPNAQCLNHKSNVFASKMSCPKCGTMRPGSAGMGMGMFPQAMVAGGCGGGRVGMLAMQMSQMPMMMASPRIVGGGKGGGANGTPGDWQCPNANCMNHSKMVFASKSSCPKCGSARPSAMPMGLNMMNNMMMGMGGGMVGGMGGGMGMSRNRGGANPGDWRCPNTDCQNHRNSVFAKHESCPKCGAEKPDDAGGFGMARSRSPHRMHGGF